MCARYEPIIRPERFEASFRVQPPGRPVALDVRPGGASAFIRLHGGQREALQGTFGLMPFWAKPTLYRHTYNARSETAAELPSFRAAWKRARHCVIPVDAIWEPDWRTGHHIPTRISLADGQPMGLAGLWEERTIQQTGEVQFSFTMLTIDAAGHDLMQNMHRPEDEKRMVVILPEDRYDDWMQASANESDHFLEQYPSELMTSAAGSTPAQFKAAVELARDVLGDQAAADTWLQTPALALDGALPGRKLYLAEGLKQVTTLLEQIRHGVYT